MRLFIAIKVSEEARRELERIQEQIKQKGVKLPSELHLTLKFLGEIDESRVGQLKKNLSDIDFSRFSLTLDGLDVFQPRHVRVVHIGVAPEGQVRELFEKIHSATADIHVDHEFRPHITVARVKFLEDRKEFLDRIGRIQVAPIEFKVDSFYLIRSTLTEKGPVYEDLAEFTAKPL